MHERINESEIQELALGLRSEKGNMLQGIVLNLHSAIHKPHWLQNVTEISIWGPNTNASACDIKTKCTRNGKAHQRLSTIDEKAVLYRVARHMFPHHELTQELRYNLVRAIDTAISEYQGQIDALEDMRHKALFL